MEADKPDDVMETEEAEVAQEQPVSSKPPAEDPQSAQKPTKTKTPPSASTLQIPLVRVKKIIKLDKDSNKATSEATFLIAKATVRDFLLHNRRINNNRNYFWSISLAKPTNQRNETDERSFSIETWVQFLFATAFF